MKRTKKPTVVRELAKAARALARAARALDRELAERPRSIPEPPPLAPLEVCDECNRAFNAGGLALHRRMVHGLGLVPDTAETTRAKATAARVVVEELANVIAPKRKRKRADGAT